MGPLSFVAEHSILLGQCAWWGAGFLLTVLLLGQCPGRVALSEDRPHLEGPECGQNTFWGLTSMFSLAFQSLGLVLAGGMPGGHRGLSVLLAAIQPGSTTRMGGAGLVCGMLLCREQSRDHGGHWKD